MQEINSANTNKSENAPSGDGNINECCKKTIHALANYNPMMVCQECKQLIKCFTNDAAFRKYLTFCKSRGRHLLVDELDQYKVVVFTSYEPFR